ncbi:hypothetical protein ACPCTO_09770 [Streptomyces olivoreticuli]
MWASICRQADSASREGGQALGVGSGSFVFGALPAFGAQGVCGVQEVGGGSATGDRDGGGGALQTVQEFGVQPGFRAEREPQEQGVLLLLGHCGDQRGEFLLRAFGRPLGRGGTGLGRDCQQVVVHAQEVRERALRCGQFVEPGRDGRLRASLVFRFGVVLEFPGGECGEPGEVEGTQIAGGEFVAYTDEGGQRVVGPLDPVAALVLAGQVEEKVGAGGPGVDVVVEAVGLDGGEVQGLLGQAEHQPMGAPVGDVQVGVEVALGHMARIPTQVTPVVGVGEAGGGDPGPGGEGPQLVLFLAAERTVEGLELVILVLAHTADPIAAADGRGWGAGKLGIAIQGQGAFRHFEDMPATSPSRL